MKKEVFIRKPKVTEWKNLVYFSRQELEMYHAVYSPRYLKFFESFNFSLHENLIKEKKENFLSAFSGGKMVGYVSWRLKPNKVAYISSLFVLPKHQRKGIGSKLIFAAEKEIKKENANAIVAETQNRAVWIKKLNKKAGYKILSQNDVRKKPFRNTFSKPLVRYTKVWGKIIK